MEHLWESFETSPATPGSPNVRTTAMNVLSEEEQKQYPIPDKDGEFYTTKLDVENAETYGQYEFLQACKEMGITVDKPNV